MANFGRDYRSILCFPSFRRCGKIAHAINLIFKPHLKKIQQGNTTKYNPIVEVNCEEEEKNMIAFIKKERKLEWKRGRQYKKRASKCGYLSNN